MDVELFDQLTNAMGFLRQVQDVDPKSPHEIARMKKRAKRCYNNLARWVRENDKPPSSSG